MRWALLSAAAAAGAFAACSEETLPAALDGGSPIVDDAGADADASPVVPKGARVLGIDVAPNSVSYPSGVALARDAGATTTNARFAWNDIETPADGGTQIFNPGLHVVNLVASGSNVGVSLSIDAIDVGGSRAPADIASRTWSDQEMATRFDNVVDYAFGQMPDAKIANLYVGADVDVALADDQAAYDAFAVFLGRVATHAKSVRMPPPRVGVVVTSAGIDAKKARLAPVWASSDVTGISLLHVDASARVRPPGDLLGDFARIAAAAPPNVPIHLRAVGSPTAPECGGSEALQADFVRAVFRAWDAHAERVGQVTFFELEDAPEAEAQAVATRAGRGSDAAYVAMLRSLGLARKSAFDALREEARARRF